VSTDYGEKERQFLASLAAESGRDLAQWMAAIDAQSLSHRNDIIDWLRQQGFMFSKASWLERIHNNGGKPIYADRTTPRPRAQPRPQRTQPASAPLPPAHAAKILPFTSKTTPPPRKTAQAAPQKRGNEQELADMLAKAKAFRPLAQYLLEEVSRLCPDTSFQPEESHVAITRTRTFAILIVNPRELRLGLALGERTASPPMQPAKLPPQLIRAAPAITHMVGLTDARQIDENLRALIQVAAETEG
jgi:Domain of unknown function (DUF5655)